MWDRVGFRGINPKYPMSVQGASHIMLAFRQVTALTALGNGCIGRQLSANQTLRKTGIAKQQAIGAETISKSLSHWCFCA
jgi:hypothetical protein